MSPPFHRAFLQSCSSRSRLIAFVLLVAFSVWLYWRAESDGPASLSDSQVREHRSHRVLTMNDAVKDQVISVPVDGGFFDLNPSRDRDEWEVTMDAFLRMQTSETAEHVLRGLDLQTSKPRVIDAIRRLARIWAEVDPMVVGDFALELPLGPGMLSILEQALLVWVGANPDAAIAWADRIADSALRDEALHHLGHELLSVDPNLALVVADRISDMEIWHMLSLRLLREMTWQGHPHDALIYLDVIADYPGKAELYAAIAIDWSTREPEQSIQLLIEKVPEESLLSHSIISVVQRWAQTEPSAVADWAEGLDSSDFSTQVFSVLAGTWASMDPFATGLWLNQLPEGLDRDHAVSEYLIQLSRWGEVDEVVELWLATIETPELRKGVERVIRRR